MGNERNKKPIKNIKSKAITKREQTSIINQLEHEKYVKIWKHDYGVEEN